MSNFTGVNAVPNNLFSAWVAEQHWCRQHAQGPRLCCCATVSGYSRAVWGAKPHRCDSSHKQGCFQLGVPNSTGACSMHRVPGIAAVQQCQVTAELYGEQNFTGVNAVPNKLFSAWVAEQHWCMQHAQGPRHCCCATVSGYSRAVWGASQISLSSCLTSGSADCGACVKFEPLLLRLCNCPAVTESAANRQATSFQCCLSWTSSCWSSLVA